MLQIRGERPPRGTDGSEDNRSLRKDFDLFAGIYWRRQARTDIPFAGKEDLMRKMIASGLVFGAAFIAANTRSQADDGTVAQRNACKPEVFRLCKEFIPDRSAITNCLQRNKERLNPECKAVFDTRSR